MADPTKEEIEFMMQLFAGYTKKIGRTITQNINGNKKLEAKCWTEDGAPDFKNWENHLKGIGAGLGIIPLTEDNTISWGAIDVDLYPANYNEIIKQIGYQKLPLVYFRSKSNGAHLFSFFDEPVPADKGQEFLRICAQKLHFENCEIFPKQTWRGSLFEAGNWLNMPYYGGMKHERCALVKDKPPLSLSEFIKEMKNEN